MINKDDLKDWLAASEREKAAQAIEQYIDEFVKAEVLKGKTTVLVSTGKCGKTCSEKTPFDAIWQTKLSEENARRVRRQVIDKYVDNGFDVSLTSVDTGWNHSAVAVQFKDLDKVG